LIPLLLHFSDNIGAMERAISKTCLLR